MLTRKDLKSLDSLHQEIEYLEIKIANYRPAEIVRDSVQGSSTSFPYTRHSVVIEGLEFKKSNLDSYYNKLSKFKNKLLEEVKRIEDELETIEDSEIRQIIRYRYFDKLTWNQVADKLDIVSEDAVRIKLNRFLDNK